MEGRIEPIESTLACVPLYARLTPLRASFYNAHQCAYNLAAAGALELVRLHKLSARHPRAARAPLPPTRPHEERHGCSALPGPGRRMLLEMS
eukprot:95504-Chlamydomonas_euryale.AAC.4